ncbi:hypothetical protein ILUMI_08226 [Ignelater luminosus]|uniref:UNC93-like protein MFSD11 n=1 Tax=Ignelater luminosus TaxID=2038154 RepID=A0A8K0D6P2_IGNLU|nr:hypothetical protein ILUMI_08226 [Ignelater luminosus]
MAVDKNFINVILLGFGFMFVFTAFQTMGNIQKTLLESIKKDDDSFNGDGYTSLAIVYAVFAVLNWLAPSVISLFGPKVAMVFGGVTYSLFIASFLWPQTWLLYLASVVIGAGAAMIWTGQGNYLTLNSNSSTISRNSGIFWAMLQMSMFIGNIFVFFQFQGLSHIDQGTRSLVIWVLLVVSIVGIVFIIILPRPNPDPNAVEQPNRGPVEALKDAGKLFITKKMLLLTVTFFYTGIELSFFSGVYSSSIGFTLQLGEAAKELVGLSGIMIGLGEVLGGALFGILGSKFTKWGRDPVVMGGFVIHLVAFFLIFLNLPNNAPFDDTNDEAFITSSAPLAIFCSFLLGFGDACFNTQIYSMLGGVFANDSASAFAIFKFVQSVAAAACFFYASHTGLYIQLGILILLAVLGTVTFVAVEWSVKRQKKNDSDEESNENNSDSESVHNSDTN